MIYIYIYLSIYIYTHNVIYIYTQIERERARERVGALLQMMQEEPPPEIHQGDFVGCLRNFTNYKETRRLRRIFFARHLQPGFPRWFYVLRPVHEERHYMVTTSPQTCSVLQSCEKKWNFQQNFAFPACLRGVHLNAWWWSDAKWTWNIRGSPVPREESSSH